MIRPLQDSRGMTLIEILFAVVVVGIGAFVIITCNNTVFTALSREQFEHKVDMEMRSLDILMSDKDFCAKNLSSIVTSNPSGNVSLPFKMVDAKPDPLLQTSAFFKPPDNLLTVTSAQFEPNPQADGLATLHLVFAPNQPGIATVTRSLPINFETNAAHHITQCSTLPLISPAGGACNLCDSTSPKLTKNLTIDFPRVNNCPWKVNGNFGRRQKHFQARLRVDKSLGLENVQVCGIKFTFHTGKINYDDHFFFLFNNAVLAASYNPAVRHLPQQSGIYSWNWDNVRGLNSPRDYLPYCVSSPPNTCSWPKTEHTGTIRMSISPETFSKIINMDPLASPKFSMITTGDNDNGDCYQSGMSFDVEVNYVERK